MQTRTVLFVDDDRITLKALHRTLKDEPYRSIFAVSGSQALEIMERETVDVVVTDLVMPEMDGMMLLDWVQAEYPDTIRVVLSALSDTDSILEAINNGSVYRYAIKPIKRRELKITVRQALELFEIQMEKKALLEELEANNQLLEKRVAERAKHLLNIDGQAAIGKHVSQAVHNLTNPLQAIFTTADMVAAQLSQEAPELDTINGLIGQIKHSAMDLEKIVESITLQVRTNAIYGAGDVDINGVILSELEFFKINPVFDKEIEKLIDLAEPAPIIFGNPVQIKQIVDNLITNAIDSMEGCETKGLSVTTLVQDDHVELRVTDTGVGIDPADTVKIFAPDYTTKPVGKGTGLGLASVKSMVEAYNGSIAVESEKGQGATFSVRLPIVSGANQSAT